MNTSLLTNKQLSAIIEVKEFMTENYFTLQNATFSTIGSYNFSSPQATTKYVDYKQDLHFYNPCKEASAPGTYATCEEVSGYVVHLSEIVVQPWFYMEPPPPM